MDLFIAIESRVKTQWEAAVIQTQFLEKAVKVDGAVCACGGCYGPRHNNVWLSDISGTSTSTTAAI